MLSIIFLGILGALIGSFANVVIYRLPEGKSIVYPGSSCPHCGHKIKPWENIPIISWLMLRGKCSNCSHPISIRYPLVEAVTALGFMILAWRWPIEVYGLSVIPLVILFALMVMMTGTDIDHYLLPDSLTLPGIAIGLLGSFLYAANSGLPDFREAAVGAAVGAGILALINRVGSLFLRRFKDTKERLWPLGMDQVNIAAVAGLLAGYLWGVIAAGLSFVVNLISRKTLRLPEPWMYALWLGALLLSLSELIVPITTALSGTFMAAGIVAVAGAVFWWLRGDLETQLNEEALEDEPIAMGFGDAKLAAVLGTFLGWQNLIVGLFLAFIFGAVGGVVQRALGGSRLIPFGPYLILGALVALFVGQSIIRWYLGMLGF